ncbi:MAG: TolC family protein [Myxococcota bacterium]|nr:TolC family protein [Myxococcota bacterium]
MIRAMIVLLAVVSTAAPAATLKEVLAASEQHNVDRQISAQQRLRAAAEFRQAWSMMLPSLTAQGTWTHNQRVVEFTLAPGTDPIVITPQNQLDGILRVELPLIDTGRWFRAAASGALLDAAGYRDAATGELITRQVATTYYGFAAALAVRSSAKRSLSVSEAQHKLQEIRMRAGAATELEVLRAKAEAERARQMVADSEALVANTRRSLFTLSGVDVGDSASLPPDNLVLEESVEDLQEGSLKLPVVKAAEKDAAAASILATAARFALVPSVTANFTERLTNATAFAGEADTWTAGVGLVWRLDAATFFGWDAQDAQGQIARLAAQRQKNASRDQVYGDWQRLSAAIKKVTAAKAQVEAAERAAQVARDRYDAGAATQLEVIQSERDLFSAEVNHIQSRTELASTHVGLRLSAGLPLKLEE